MAPVVLNEERRIPEMRPWSVIRTSFLLETDNDRNAIESNSSNPCIQTSRICVKQGFKASMGPANDSYRTAHGRLAMPKDKPYTFAAALDG